MDQLKSLGKIISFDAINRRVTLEIDFFDVEKQEVIENLLATKERFSFSFSKPFRESKSYAQLKLYFRWLTKIIVKLGMYPTAAIVKAMDYVFKTQAFPCEHVEIGGSSIPTPKSKAVYSKEEMQHLIEWVDQTYGVVVHEELEGE